MLISIQLAARGSQVLKIRLVDKGEPDCGCVDWLFNGLAFLYKCGRRIVAKVNLNPQEMELVN
ncbi:hypothetical protein KQH56_00710 [bacterium]|nr:hypothetical protein [bacterium]